MVFPTFRIEYYEKDASDTQLRENLDLLEGRWAKAHLTYKKAVARLYNSKVCPLRETSGDLVLRKAEVSDPDRTRDKLALTCEGLYRVIKIAREGTCILAN
ncbi:hypothetical protein BHE74_00046042 [Ensete ventricosum]|nr:hypothetical protein BHE74_00046042 [Ensete ventricosum]